MVLLQSSCPLNQHAWIRAQTCHEVAVWSSEETGSTGLFVPAWFGAVHPARWRPPHPWPFADIAAQIPMEKAPACCALFAHAVRSTVWYQARLPPSTTGLCTLLLYLMLCSRHRPDRLTPAVDRLLRPGQTRPKCSHAATLSCTPVRHSPCSCTRQLPSSFACSPQGCCSLDSTRCILLSF